MVHKFIMRKHLQYNYGLDKFILDNSSNGGLPYVNEQPQTSCHKLNFNIVMSVVLFNGANCSLQLMSAGTWLSSI